MPLVLYYLADGHYINNQPFAFMPKNENWVKWRKHPAREVILQDLNYGGWLYDELKDEDLNLAAVFALYNHKHPDLTNSKKGWRTTLKRTTKEAIDQRESMRGCCTTGNYTLGS